MLRKVTYFLEQSWLLLTASFVFGLLLAIANAAWSPRILQNKIDKLNRLMTGLIPQAQSFETVTDFQIKSLKGKIVKTTIYKAVAETKEAVGWAFICSGPGFADKIELVVAVDSEFEKIAGFAVLASNETPGFGDRIKEDYYRSQFSGTPIERLRLVKTGDPKKIDAEIVAITGATVSSEAVVKIINNSVTQLKNKMHEEELISNAE